LDGKDGCGIVASFVTNGKLRPAQLDYKREMPQVTTFSCPLRGLPQVVVLTGRGAGTGYEHEQACGQGRKT
jgi:hypothetical protein